MALFGGAQPPTVVAALPPVTLAADSPPTLTATLGQPAEGTEIVRAAVRINRDRDVSRFDGTGKPDAETTGVPQGGTVSVTLPEDLKLAPAQLVSLQWRIDYRRKGGGEMETVLSDPVGARIGCTGEQVEAFLAGVQKAAMAATTVPQTLTAFDDFSALAGRGYVPRRGFTSVQGQGLVLSRTDLEKPPAPAEAAEGTGETRAGVPPAFLFYLPPSTLPLATVTDGFPDFPYRLAGIGFAVPYQPDGPPALGCMPREAWTVSEAGWYTAGGGFVATGPVEAQPGDVAAVPKSTPPRTGTVFHNRLWVVHVFFRSDGAPVLATCNPGPEGRRLADHFPAPGLAACNGAAAIPPFGARLSAGDYLLRTLPP